MPDALSHLDQVLDYVYTEARGKSTEVVPILEFCESLGLDMDDAFTISRALYDADMTERSDTMGSPRISLTGRGLAYVSQMRERRDDPAIRAAACRTGLLRWFYRQHVAAVRLPLTDGFGQTDAAKNDGTPFTAIEIQHAAEYLANKDLIKGATVAEIRGPVRAEITTEGIDCVTDWSGDVAQYLRDQRGYGPTTNYHGPVFNAAAEGNQLAWQNRDVVQNAGGQQIAPGYEPLAAAVADLIRALPTFGLPEQDRQDVEDAAEEIVGEIVQHEQNPGRLRRGVAAIRTFLMPIANGAVEGISDQTREEAGQLVERLTASLS
ncbi:hypothetical protein [Actinoplanes subglobosus]|uniref:Uncharacterized protein n=1 Tax=Actinoplanes subglobosus TaxID=1547892 RepID=A0ABV8JA67_9ACTN